MNNNENKVPTTDYYAALNKLTDALAAKNGARPGVFVHTFGCQQNEADSERYVGMAVKAGYEYTDDPKKAYLIIFNTCAVREHAELKALSLVGQLKHLKAENPELIVCVCGCMVAQEHRLNDIKNKYPYVDLLLGATSQQKFPEYLYSVFVRRANKRERKKRMFYPDTDAILTEGLPVRRDSAYSAWVSIMYGCNNFCTYCVVPYVRGRERSRDKSEILSEIKGLVGAGYKEITLLGQNVNSYRGGGEGYDFADLLSDICKIKGDYLIRFMTSHPKDASHKLIDVMAENSQPDSAPRVARHFHLPLQAGSDRVLKAMNRRYDTEKYLETVSYMRQKMPDIAITTDIIVGFPGEDEEDFSHTLEMLEKVRFDALFSFIYSKRRGTPAAEMEQVPDKVKTERFARLLEVQNRISLEKNRDYIGSEQRVLVEGISKTNPDMMTGRNEKGRLIHFAGPTSLNGSFVKVKVISADTYSINGELLNT